jgi:serine/threonine protein kinase
MAFKTNDLISNRFELISRLGIGGFADVWKTHDRYKQEIFAIKLFVRQDADGIRLCTEEFDRGRELEHPYILRPMDIGVHEDSPYLLMEYCPNGTALSMSQKLDEAGIAKLMFQIGSALHHIHNMPEPIIHNDIKPDNFLIDRNWDYRLSDFGISDRLEMMLTKSVDASRKNELMTQKKDAGVAPMAYLPPETFNFKDHQKQKAIKASDIWAFGVSMFQLITGELPFGNGGQEQLIVQHSHNTTLDEMLPNLPAGYSKDLYDILKRCLHIDTWERPFAADLVRWSNNYQHTGDWFSKDEAEVVRRRTTSGKKKFIPKISPKIGNLRGKLGWAAVVAAVAGSGALVYKTISDTPIAASIPQKSEITVAPATTVDTVLTPIKNTAPTPKTVVASVPMNAVDEKAKKKVEEANESITSELTKPERPQVEAPKVLAPQQVEQPKVSTATREGLNKPSTSGVQTSSLTRPSNNSSSSGATYYFSSSGKTPASMKATKIEQTGDATIVYFTLQEGNVSLYSPSEPDHAFYIRAKNDKGGTKYRIRRVGGGMSFGEGQKIPSGGVSFRAYFERVPDGLCEIDIMEGENQTDASQTYWNFKGMKFCGN